MYTKIKYRNVISSVMKSEAMNEIERSCYRYLHFVSYPKSTSFGRVALQTSGYDNVMISKINSAILVTAFTGLEQLESTLQF